MNTVVVVVGFGFFFFFLDAMQNKTTDYLKDSHPIVEYGAIKPLYTHNTPAQVFSRICLIRAACTATT